MVRELDELQLESDRRLVMLVFALQLIPTLWFVRTDLALVGDDWPRLWPRLLVRTLLAGVSVAGIVSMRRITTRHAYRQAVLILALALVATVLALNTLRTAGASLPLRTPLYVLAVLYFGLPNTFRRQILPALLLSTGVVGLRLFYLTGGTESDPAGDVLMMTVMNLVGIYWVRRRLALEDAIGAALAAEREARLASERSRAELRTLHGIIPICAHCKRVRPSAGTWQQIERYVREHSEAEFSHSICPDCLVAHYDESVRPG